ncbi:MAG: lysophospholipid acyltransferase family protein [Christensenellales bacterium]|jgi:1-acyl-sn-glycerol-3-phosphate acyltransferase
MSGFYAFAHAVVKPIFAVLFPTRTTGREHVPQQGACILTVNHLTGMDVVLVGLAMKRQVHFFGKAELFENKFLNRLLSSLNAYPVNRGQADLKAVRWAMDLLKRGEIFGIFPEGTRNHENDALQDMSDGAALIALKTKVPVIPVVLTGRCKLFRRVHIAVGEPVDLADLTAQRASKEVIDQGTARIHGAMAALLDRTRARDAEKSKK